MVDPWPKLISNALEVSLKQRGNAKARLEKYSFALKIGQYFDIYEL
ncbi:hypothetical protein VOA_000661 [Vibrio sp. RC586]|nr:hypothetical protein VOA_000661 [Vibrio sp. RC586]